MNLDVDSILLCHKLIVEEQGGEQGVLNYGALESVANGVYGTFDGKEFYKTKEEKAAYLCFGIVNNHSFVDGNKRVGVSLMLSFLNFSGIKIKTTNDDLIDLGISVASSKYGFNDIIQWITNHKIKQ